MIMLEIIWKPFKHTYMEKIKLHLSKGEVISNNIKEDAKKEEERREILKRAEK